MAKATPKNDRRGGAQSIGQKKAFTAEQIQLIRYKVTEGTKGFGGGGYLRRLALLETALSTCLRSVDLLALTVADVDHGKADAFILKQKKTGKVMRVRLSTKARVAIHAMIQAENLGPQHRLFRYDRQDYALIVKGWAIDLGLNPKHYSTHSMRRTTPAHLYKKTGNVKAAAELLGHADVSNTGAYLGIGTEEAHQLAGEHEI